MEATLASGNGVINPPLGEKISDDDPGLPYKDIGDILKKQFKGYTAWLITSNKIAANQIVLHASRKITLFNGGLECKFMRFELYEGTKKGIKN